MPLNELMPLLGAALCLFVALWIFVRVGVDYFDERWWRRQR